MKEDVGTATKPRQTEDMIFKSIWNIDLMRVLTVFVRMEQKDFCEFKLGLGYLVCFRPIWVTEWDPLSKTKWNKQIKYWRRVVRVQYLLCLVLAKYSVPWKPQKCLKSFHEKDWKTLQTSKSPLKCFWWVTCKWTCRLNFHLSPHVLKALTGKGFAKQAGFCWTQSSLLYSTSPNVAGSSIPALAILIQSTVNN